MSPFFPGALLTTLIVGLSGFVGSPRTPAHQSLDDPTDLAVFEYLVTYDIETSGIAAKKATNADVRELANSFANAHRGLLKKTKDLATKVHISPTQPKEAPMAEAHAEALRKLNATTGEEFDHVYLANEVAYHQGAITILEDSLVPAIKNPELKALAKGAVSAFQAHLTASKQLADKYHAS